MSIFLYNLSHNISPPSPPAHVPPARLPPQCHRDVVAFASSLVDADATLLAVGGDHSITFPLLEAAVGALAGSPRHAAAQPALQVREGFSSVCFEYRIYLHLLGVSVSLSLGLSSFSFFISLPLRPSPALPLCLSALTLPFSLNLTLTNSHPIPSHHNSLTHRHHTSLHLSLPTARATWRASRTEQPQYPPLWRASTSTPTRTPGTHCTGSSSAMGRRFAGRWRRGFWTRRR